MRRISPNLLLTAVFVMIFALAACGNNQDPVDVVPTAPPTTQAEAGTSSDLVIEGTNEEKVVIISQIVTEEAKGLLQVVRADVPLHGQTPTGYDYYGAHYRVVVLHSVHDLTEEEVGEVNHLTARIFELTTKEILKDNTDITHMGVQVVYPDIWPLGFAGTDSDDPSAIYVASRRDLMGVLGSGDAVASDYLSVAGKDKIHVVRESQLQGD